MKEFPLDQSLIFLAGLAGAAGVGLSAAAAHMPGTASLGTAGIVALAQAPALLAIGLRGAEAGTAIRLAGLVIGAGIVLFTGEIAFHELTGNASLTGIAPIGGTAMIAGWVAIAVCAAITHRR